MASVKTMVGEWRRYIEAPWEHTDAWMDDENVILDGVEVGSDNIPKDVPDATPMVVDGGTVYIPSVDPDHPEDTVVDLPTHFRRWLKKQTTALVLVEIDKTKIDSLKTALKSIGAKITQ